MIKIKTLIKCLPALSVITPIGALSIYSNAHTSPTVTVSQDPQYIQWGYDVSTAMANDVIRLNPITGWNPNDCVFTREASNDSNRSVTAIITNQTDNLTATFFIKYNKGVVYNINQWKCLTTPTMNAHQKWMHDYNNWKNADIANAQDNTVLALASYWNSTNVWSGKKAANNQFIISELKNRFNWFGWVDSVISVNYASSTDIGLKIAVHYWRDVSVINKYMNLDVIFNPKKPFDWHDFKIATPWQDSIPGN